MIVNMNDGTITIILILKHFVVGVRIEKLLTLAYAIFFIITGTKVNQYQLAAASSKLINRRVNNNQ